ncbi:MAG: hypothetical protein DCC55_05925 [Chloroflexi bacterium]|nr:MAG: hypothetical protein DCC55_05925 [Chloroflexota bacterium]
MGQPPRQRRPSECVWQLRHPSVALLVAVCVCTGVMFLALYFALFETRSFPPPFWPKNSWFQISRSIDAQSRAVDSFNTSEAQAIMAVMLQFYQLLRETPVRTLDVRQFAEVLKDTPDYKLTAETQDYLSVILGSEAAQSAGYLTAMQAKWTHLQQGDRLARGVIEQAQAENREVTAEEWQALAEQNHGRLPPTFTDPDSDYKVQLQYESIEINEDSAVVRFDDGVAYQEAILRHIKGRWYITNITPISVHF